jgi:CRISPR-associated protein Cas2
MFTVISYDIVENRRRTKVLKFLKGWGTHVQYSVFECELSPPELLKVQRGLAQLIDRQTDSVRLYQLDAAMLRRAQVLGVGRISLEEAYVMVRDDTPRDPGPRRRRSTNGAPTPPTPAVPTNGARTRKRGKGGP